MRVNKKRAALTFVIGLTAMVSVFTGAEAGHRIHDPKVDTKVTANTHSSASASTDKQSFKDRINAILHPQTEKKPSFSGVLAPVDYSNEEILGRPMATQEQCVEYLLSNNPYPEISVSPSELVAYY